MFDLHAAGMIAVAALVTAATRFLPFLIFRNGKNIPKTIMQLGKALPCAVMGMLVIYCLKDIRPLAYPYGIPEIIGCLTVALLHIRWRNTLLSIGAGTGLYMLLVQLVF